jgi:hypothetical protein
MDMRPSLLVGVLLLSTWGWAPLGAQTNTNGGGTPGGDRRARMIGFLPAADQDRVMNAYNKAMTDNPALKTEGDDLMQQAESLQDASPEERQGFMEKVRTHQEKIRKAMLKEDPDLAPILDRIDKHMSEAKAKNAKAMSEPTHAPAGTNAAPVH